MIKHVHQCASQIIPQVLTNNSLHDKSCGRTAAAAAEVLLISTVYFQFLIFQSRVLSFFVDFNEQQQLWSTSAPMMPLLAIGSPT